MSRVIVLLLAIVSAPLAANVTDKCAQYNRLIKARALDVIVSNGLVYSEHRGRLMGLTTSLDDELSLAWSAVISAREEAGLEPNPIDPAEPSFYKLWTAYIEVYGALLEWHIAEHMKRCDVSNEEER